MVFFFEADASSGRGALRRAKRGKTNERSEAEKPEAHRGQSPSAQSGAMSDGAAAGGGIRASAPARANAKAQRPEGARPGPSAGTGEVPCEAPSVKTVWARE